MEKQTLLVPGISCGHCVRSIKNELSDIDGVTAVEGDPETKRITVSWTLPATIEIIKKTLEEMNYPVG